MKTEIYKGKTRDIYEDDNDNEIIIVSSDRISSFDRHICNIPGKGEILNKMSTFWFNATKHIIPNHMISSDGGEMIAKKCSVIPVEIVVRGYITGNTRTSLWEHYNQGKRDYCGIHFEDNLKKNQKLKQPIITPTTKSKSDEPISKDDIVSLGFATEDECDYIYTKALELFQYGQMLSHRAGFILVDTKYEFGRDVNGNIILIDELHTCDSSRFWVEKSYKDRFSNGQEPEKLDKDCVRDWVLTKCNPYVNSIPEIPHDIMANVSETYERYYNSIIKTLPTVGIIMGSESDLPVMKKASNILEELDIQYEITIVSAHRTPDRMFEYARNAKNRGLKVIIAGAGGSAHLPGMVAAITPLPVIGVPIKLNSLDGMDSLLSIVQMPRGVPVATVSINGSENAGLLAARILGASDLNIIEKVESMMNKAKLKVLDTVSKMAETNI